MAKRSIPKRAERYTVLIVTEGESEEAFLRYLRSLVRAERSVTIESAHGGSPEYVVERTERLKKDRSYRETLAWVDTDRFRVPEERTCLFTRAAKKRICLLFSERCFEGFLLSLLEPNANWAARGTADAKKHLDNKYHSEKRSTDPSRYAEFFKYGFEEMDELRKRDSDSGHLLDVLMTALFGVTRAAG